MACPECSGPQMAGHPAGVLTFQHEPRCGIYAAQSQTAYADFDRTADAGGPVTRPVTPTEEILLAAVGIPVPAEVKVSRVSDGGAVILREF